ncbi:MAG: hypothetical protein ACREHD_33700 [Pirellulales bacterium]
MVSIVAFVIAWPLSIANTSPQNVAMTIIGLGVVLAVIVGYRRHGSTFVRIGAAAAFFAGALVVAFFSASAASVWQGPTEPVHPLDELGNFLTGFVLLLTFPAVLAVMLLLLRAWTWSAHDRMIHRPDIDVGAPDRIRESA